MSECERCQGRLPLKSGKCRFCTLLLRETETDVSGIALVGEDQLWLGREFALRSSDRYLSGHSQGRFKAKQRRSRAASLARRPTSPHVVDPAQLELFPTPPRDWSRPHPEDEYTLTPEAKALLSDFFDYLRERGVDPRFAGAGSLRTLRVLTAQLGVEAPIHEEDVNIIATLSGHHNGRRVVCFLRQHGLLKPRPVTNAELVRARKLADSLPGPFADAVHTWIDVLLGQGSRSNPALASGTIYVYVQNAAPILRAWAASGASDLRQITRRGHRNRDLGPAPLPPALRPSPASLAVPGSATRAKDLP